MNRYITTITAYVWAENDLDATSESLKLTTELLKLSDNRAEVEAIHIAPFGKLSTDIKQIYPKQK